MTKNKTNNKNFFKKIFLKLNKKILIIYSSVLTGLVITTIITLNINNIQHKKDENKTCSIQFNTNGGSEVSTIDFECGKLAKEPKPPEKSGFEFIGWYFNDQKFDFSSKIDKNIVIEAKWEAKEETEIIKVFFDTKGGSLINAVEIAKGETINPPLKPTKKGYEFNSWTYKDKTFDFSTPIENEITLVATWKKIDTSTKKETSNKDKTDVTNKTENNLSSNNKYKCSYNYDNNIPEKTVDTSYKDHINWTFSTGMSYSADDCYITYKSSNSSVASISDDGKITTHKKGTAYVYECINDTATKKELGCFKAKLIVNNSVHQEEEEKTLAFANSINGYYWYLDGYEYAYIHTSIIDWYDHTLLKWDSKYMAIENDKFVTSEETEKFYSSDSNINNYFLMNPTELGYDIIEKYKMKVSGSKLYITLGGKQYSFTKRTNAKPNGKVSLDLSSMNLTLDENTSTKLYVTLKSHFFEKNIQSTSSDSKIANCNYYDSSESKVTFICYGNSPGNATITIKDTIGGTSKTLNITVNDVVIPVTSISSDKLSINLERGATESLYVIVTPSNADNKKVLWSSSDTSIAYVNNRGVVTANKKGTTTITATTEDGRYSVKFDITVSNPELKVSGSLGIRTEFSTSGITRGIHAKVNISGGTGEYASCHMKVYKDEILIGEADMDELFIPGYTNGAYTIEYEVRDSDGNIKKGTTSTTISGF